MCRVMGNLAYEKAINSLSWRSYGEKMYEFYNKIVSSK